MSKGEKPTEDGFAFASLLSIVVVGCAAVPVSEIDIFLFSTGNFNIIALGYMKKLKNIARSTRLLRRLGGTTR